MRSKCPRGLEEIGGEIRKMHLPPRCMVYFLVREGEVVYVGQSRAILGRLQAHMPGKRFDAVYYLPVPWKKLDEVERKWIERLKPIYNKAGLPIDLPGENGAPAIDPPEVVELLVAAAADSQRPRPVIVTPEEWVPGYTQDRSKFRFVHNAHRFTLYKRGEAPMWYLKFRHKGKQAVISLKTPEALVAKVRAISHYTRVKSGAWTEIAQERTEKREEVKQAAVKVGQILDRYEDGVQLVNTEISDGTVKANALALKRLIKMARAWNGEEGDVAVHALALAELNEEMITAFKVRYLAAAGEDKRAQESRRRGGNSVIRQARAVFSQDAMKLYKTLMAPEALEKMMKGFMKASGFSVKKALVMEIPGEVMASMTAKAWEELRELNPALWLAHLCYKHLGMRNIEIAAARWGWLTTREGGGGWMVIDQTAEFDPKGSLGRIPVPADVYGEFLTAKGTKSAEEFLIPAANQTARCQIVYRDHSAFVKRFLALCIGGIESSEKTSYRLRKWAGDTIRMKYNDDASKAFLRHADGSVAAGHYWSAYNWAKLAELRKEEPRSVGITLADAGHACGS